MDEMLEKMLLINKIRNAEALSNTNPTMGEVKCLQGKYNAMYNCSVNELKQFIVDAGIE